MKSSETSKNNSKEPIKNIYKINWLQLNLLDENEKIKILLGTKSVMMLVLSVEILL
jgi:hypothetical protein